MKKVITLSIIGVLLLTITGCGCSKKKEEKLQVELKDDVKATAEITQNVDIPVVRIKFERRKEKERVKVKLIYYKNKKEVYRENIIYVFPASDVECLLDIPIVNEYRKVKDETKVIENKEYTNENTKKVKLEYDKLKLKISE